MNSQADDCRGERRGHRRRHGLCPALRLHARRARREVWLHRGADWICARHRLDVLLRQVGEKIARDLLLTVASCAEEALKMGLVNEIVRRRSCLTAPASSAAHLKENSPLSLFYTSDC